MIPKLVTFDCAGTLIRTGWSIPAVLTEAARRVGLEIDSSQANLYFQFYANRLEEFAAVNRLRSQEAGKQFWINLGRDWLTEIKLDPSTAESLTEEAEDIAFGTSSDLFTLYDDAIPCLDGLSDKGIDCAIVSNWDYSLTRVLAMVGIDSRFRIVLASLEEGFEKPDPQLFLLALERAGVRATEAVHVGDDKIDDLAGAHAAGIRAVLLDRTGQTPGSIRSLVQLQEAFSWSS